MVKSNFNTDLPGRRLVKADYNRRNGHFSKVIWLTGLSGAGKSTLAHCIEELLFSKGVYTYLLDGDIMRNGLNSNLGFSEEDRRENIRRAGEVAKMFFDAGMVVLAAFISPYQEDRDRIRACFGESEFIEVYVKCDLAICEQRDTKGLYRKARAGELPDFTGIDSPYEEPIAPELIVDTGKLNINEAVNQIIKLIDIDITQKAFRKLLTASPPLPSRKKLPTTG